MEVEYNKAKNQRNIEERGLSFDEVMDFDFSTANVIEDTRHDYPEQRIVATGYLGSRLHVLCFTPINGGIRVISFRKANKREVKSYES
ncbi:MAG: BrnT family toxin [Porticoccus sp.]